MAEPAPMTTTAAPASGDSQPAKNGGHGSTASVFAAIAANILVGIVKFIRAISESAAMISEGIHSIVDSGNGIAGAVGALRSSKKKPTIEHPLALARALLLDARGVRPRCSRWAARLAHEGHPGGARRGGPAPSSWATPP